MSNFLVRLAQRSIGQVPFVRSRAMFVPPLIGAPMPDAPVPPARATALTVDASPERFAAAAQTAGELAPAIPLPVAAPSAIPPQAENHPTRTTRVITEVIERPVPTPPAAPVEHDRQRPTLLTAITDERSTVTQPIQLATTVAIQAISRPVAVPDLAAQAPTRAPIVSHPDAELAFDHASAKQPVPIEFMKPRHVSLDATGPVDLTAALAPANRALPVDPGRNAVPPALPPTQTPMPSEERIVEVRIGTIEIRAPLSAPAAPVAIPMQRSLPRGGFDEFSRLRSYAPWEL